MTTKPNAGASTNALKEAIQARMPEIAAAYYAREFPGAKPSGNGWINGNCPLPGHEDKNPSCGANIQTGRFNCFGNCGKGSIFDFHATKYGVDYPAAVREIAQFAGIDVGPGASASGGRNGGNGKARTTTATAKPKVIPESALAKLRPVPEEIMVELARRRGWTREAVDALDLRMDRERIAIPVRDSKGALRNIRHYQPFPERRSAKGGKIISHKAGSGSARLLIHAPNADAPVYLCEGEPDYIRVVSESLNGATLTGNLTRWTDEHKGPLRDREVIILPDTDFPGFGRAATATANLAGIAAGIRIVQWPKVMERPEGGLFRKHGKDVTDFFQDHGGTAGSLLDYAIPAADFFGRIVEEAMPLLCQWWDGKDEDGNPFVRDIAGKLAAGKKALTGKQMGAVAGAMEKPLGAIATELKRESAAPDLPPEEKDRIEYEAATWGMRAAACRAFAALPAETPAGKPVIIHNRGQFPEIMAQTWEALEAYNGGQSPILFRTEGGALLELRAGESHEVGKDEIRHHLAECAAWYKASNSKDGGTFDSLPPDEVIAEILSRPERLPVIRRFIPSPVYAESGALHNRPGYDPETMLYLTGKPVDLAKMPTPGEAVAFLRDWLVDFKFEPFEACFANALSLPLTLLTRSMYADEPIPHNLVTAPTQGSGKSLLAEIFLRAVTKTGKEKPVSLADWRGNDEELRKALTSEFQSGTPTEIFWDNIKSRFTSPLLDKAATGVWGSDRILGINKNVRYPIGSPVRIFTLNNFTADRDAMRRSVTIRLDTKMARPELRTDFRHPDIKAYTARNREKILLAMICLVENWKAKGRPSPAKIPPFGSFEKWRGVVGGILEAAGIDGLLGNATDAAEAADTRTSAIREIISAWVEHRTGSDGNPRPMKPAEILSLVEERMIDGPFKRDAQRIGYFLRDCLGQIHEDHKGRLWRIGKRSVSGSNTYELDRHPEEMGVWTQTPTTPTQPPQPGTLENRGFDGGCGGCGGFIPRVKKTNEDIQYDSACAHTHIKGEKAPQPPQPPSGVEIVGKNPVGVSWGFETPTDGDLDAAPESRKQEVCATCRAIGTDNKGRPVCFARTTFDGKPDRGKLIHRNQPACGRWQPRPEPTPHTSAGTGAERADGATE